MQMIDALSQGTENAIRRYYAISAHPYVTEGFIRDGCALFLNEQMRISVCIELSRTHVENDLGRNPDIESTLNNYKIDLVTFSKTTASPNNIDCLIEFKLYTGKGAIDDIKRMKTIISLSGIKIEN